MSYDKVMLKRSMASFVLVDHQLASYRWANWRSTTRSFEKRLNFALIEMIGQLSVGEMTLDQLT